MKITEYVAFYYCIAFSQNITTYPNISHHACSDSRSISREGSGQKSIGWALCSEDDVITWKLRGKMMSLFPAFFVCLLILVLFCWEEMDNCFPAKNNLGNVNEAASLSRPPLSWILRERELWTWHLKPMLNNHFHASSKQSHFTTIPRVGAHLVLLPKDDQ